MRLRKRAPAEEKEARQDADRKAEEAKKSQEFAFEQAQVGLETVLNVVTTMNQKMRPIAELGPLRKELLQDALKRLEIIPKGAVAFGKVDRTTGITLQQMGKIYEQMGDTQNQTQVIEKSLEIFARLMAEQPEEDLNRYNATISHDALGEIGRENWADPSKIAFHFNRSLEMRKELVANKQSPKPEMSLRQHALAIAFQNWAVLALELGDPVKALEYAKDYLKQSQTALAADPKNEYARRELISSAYVLIGKASTRIPDSNDGPRYLRNSLLLRQEWIKAIPVDDYGKQELARSLDAMGDLETELGHYADAQDFYQRSLVIFQELQKKAPYVPEFQWFRANVDYHLGTVYRLQNNEKAAHEHFSSCAETPEKSRAHASLCSTRPTCGGRQNGSGDYRIRSPPSRKTVFGSMRLGHLQLGGGDRWPLSQSGCEGS